MDKEEWIEGGRAFLIAVAIVAVPIALIVLPLLVHALNTGAACPGNPDNGCWEYWLNRYQTLIGALIALFAALYAVGPVKKQIAIQSRQSALDLRDRLLRARTTMTQFHSDIARKLDQVERFRIDEPQWPEGTTGRRNFRAWANSLLPEVTRFAREKNAGRESLASLESFVICLEDADGLFASDGILAATQGALPQQEIDERMEKRRQLWPSLQRAKHNTVVLGRQMLLALEGEISTISKSAAAIYEEHMR